MIHNHKYLQSLVYDQNGVVVYIYKFKTTTTAVRQAGSIVGSHCILLSWLYQNIASEITWFSPKCNHMQSYDLKHYKYATFMVDFEKCAARTEIFIYDVIF